MDDMDNDMDMDMDIDIGKRAMVATQAVEVFSIRIKSEILRPHSDDTEFGILSPHTGNEVYGIFGTIHVEDEIPGDNTLYLYNRGSNDIDYIHSTSGTSLSLLTLARPIAPTKLLRIVFDLKTKDGGELIKGSYPLDVDADTLNSYDRCLVKDCIGNLGLANIYYSVLSVANTSIISIAWVKASGEAEIIKQSKRPLGGPRPGKEKKVEEIKVEEPVLPLRYYGSVVAYYGRNFKYPPKEDEKNYWRVMLLNITKDDCVLGNGEIPLSRSRVTVPAYSSLVIKVRLTALDSTSEERRKYRLRGKLVYDVQQRDTDIQVLRKLDQSLCVTLHWRRDEMPFIGVRHNEYICSGGRIMDVSSVRVFINQNTDDKKDIEVYGTVLARDSDELTLFSHEKDDSVHLFSGDVLPLNGLPRCIDGFHFDVTLSLKEKSQDLEICHGYWEIHTGSDWRLYGTRLAAVFEGKDGYAVMHFTLYSSAVQAIMEAKLCVDTDAAIYGSLIARMENDEHAGEYVKKYFQTRLFDVSEADRVMLKPNCESGQPAVKQILLPLMIGGVAVHGEGHLIIEANLAYKTEVSKEWVKIESLVKLKPAECGESEFHIGEKDGGIDGRVGWFFSPWHARALCKTYTGEDPLFPPEDKKSFKKTVVKNWT